MKTNVTPPRIAKWLLQMVVRGTHREFLLGDLDELFETDIAPKRSPAGARRWYWRQTLAIVITFGGYATRLRASVARPVATPTLSPALGNAPRIARLAFRSLRRQPLFTTAAVLTLALGVGATTAVMTVVNALFVQTLPYADADRLAFVWRIGPNGERLPNGFANLSDVQAEAETFDGMAAWLTFRGNLTGIEESAALDVGAVTSAYFSLLDVAPIVGRVLNAEDDASGRNVLVLSEPLWRSHFGADPGVVGRIVTVSARTFEIVGVAEAAAPLDPARSNLLEWDVWQPLSSLGPALTTSRTRTAVQAIARVAPGWTLDQAREELRVIGEGLRAAHSEENERLELTAVSVREQLFGNLTRPLWLLMTGALLVFIVSSINVAALLLVRATSKAREAAVRRALGASPAQIVTETSAETVVLMLAGGALGVVFAQWGLDLFFALSPIQLPAFVQPGIDTRVAGGVLTLLALAAVPVTIAPVLRALRGEVHDTLGGSREGGRFSRGRPRRLLVATEVAIATAVLIGSGLLLRSLFTLRAVDVGFDTAGLTLVPVNFSRRNYADVDRLNTTIAAIADQLTARPDVQSVSVMGSGTPGYSGLSVTMGADGTSILGREATGDVVRFRWHRVSSSFLQQLGLEVIEGRGLGPEDRTDAPTVAVISQGLAERLWPGESAIGRQVPQPRTPRSRGETVLATVVGVVRDARHGGRVARRLQIQSPHDVYFPWAQQPNHFPQFVVRTSLEPAMVIAATRMILREADRDLVIGNVRTVEQQLDREVALPRFMAVLMTTFAGLAVALATVGLYATLAYSVARRVRELGIRVALGATRADNVRLFVGEGVVVGATGVSVGIFLGFVVTRLATGLLFGVSALDPVAFLAAPALLLATVIVASYLPARRASDVPPAFALRSE